MLIYVQIVIVNYNGFGRDVRYLSFWSSLTDLVVILLNLPPNFKKPLKNL